MLTFKFVTESVSRSGLINLRLPTARATCGLQSSSVCSDVNAVPATASLPTIYSPSFTGKVERITSTTSGSAPPTFRPAPPAWRHVYRVCATVIARRCCCHCTTTGQVVRHGSSSSSAAKGRFKYTHAISDAPVQPLVDHRLRTCFFQGLFVTPVLNKSGVDKTGPTSYRPISKLSERRSFPRCWNV